MTAPVDIVGRIFDLYAGRGHLCYGEGVTQLEHALQAAAAAEKAGAPAVLIAAAFLHDIGHLLQDAAEDAAERGIDTEHQSVASAWLSRRFRPELCEAVRLHVAAKRYLCHAEPGYFDRLSAASRLSLALQGGPLDAAGAAAYLSEKGAAGAIALRRWDDDAKVAGLATPDMAHFRPVLEASLKAL